MAPQEAIIIGLFLAFGIPSVLWVLIHLIEIYKEGR